MSPLELFRRNQKVMMTGLIMLAMFAFVVLPAVSEYMARSGGPGMVDPVMAEFNGVTLTASRVNQFTRQHYQTVQFLRKLAQETIRRGGTPQVPGFSYDQQSGQIQSLGINSSPSDDLSIRTMQFAAEAQERGFTLDDTSLENWMERFTGGTMSDREIYGLLQRESNNQMGQYQLFAMLRQQLLSQLLFRGSSATVSRGQFPLQSPLDHWQNFLKLNQQATINAYGVLVNDYLDEVDYSPSQAEVVALYEEAKDRYPSEQSPEPGFRRRPTATFEYLMADLQKFRDAEVEKLSEEAIRAEYERRKAGGSFELPPEEPAVEPETPAAETTQPAAEMKDDKASADKQDKPAAETEPQDEPQNSGEDKQTETDPAKMLDKKLNEAATLTLPAMPADAQPQKPDAKPEPAPKKTDQDAGEDKQPADKPVEDDKPAENAKPDADAVKETDPDGGEDKPKAEAETKPEAEDKGEAEKSPEGEQSSAVADENGVRLVAMQADVSTEDAATETEDAPAGDAPADEKTPADETNPADADAPDGQEPAAAKPADEKPADEKPADEKPAAETEPGEAEPEPEPRYQSFEEVRDQVAQSMAENPARVALDQALSKARGEMRQYFSRRAIYESTNDPTGPPPERPDLQAMAEALGLEYRKIGPHTPVSLADEPIANSFEEGTAMSQRGVPFTAMMFGVEGQVNKEALFRPVVSVDLENQRSYLAWKVDETEAYTPELSEVRDEVVKAIRFERARDIAQQAAKSMAEKVNEGADLKELVPEDRDDMYFTDLGPFSWLNMVGFGNVSIGNVPELDSVGQEFMKAVFTADEDEAVVAPNEPERVYYVINRTSLQPATADLRAIFMQQSERFMAMFMSDGTAAKVQEGFFEEIDAKTDFDRYELEE